MGLSGRWESSNAVAAAMEEIVTYGLPDTYFDSCAQRIRSVTPGMALEAGHRLVPGQNFTWVVVGDRGRIEAALGELGIEVRLVNADGESAIPNPSFRSRFLYAHIDGWGRKCPGAARICASGDLEIAAIEHTYVRWQRSCP